MPTTIREGVEDTEKCLVAERAIERLYPDAYRWKLPGRGYVWGSRSCLQDCTYVDLVCGESGPQFALYLKVEGMAVFYPFTIDGLVTIFSTLQDKNPELHAKLVEAIKETKPGW
jgi:hypothetical protein